MIKTFQNCIIYLIGYPGTGKYTIAKKIVSFAPEFRLVDNHLINNPLFSIILADGKTPLPSRVWKNVGQIWEAVLDTMIHISPPDYSFVLTNALLNSQADQNWFAEVEHMADQRKALFVPVILTVSLDEHRRRIVMKDRAERFKEIDPDSPDLYAKEDSIIKLNHPNLLLLDTSCLTAEESAESIRHHLLQLLP